MPFSTTYIFVQTTEGTDVVNLTPQIQMEVRKSLVKNGSVTVFIPGSTASLTTIEFESGAVNDLKKAIEGQNNSSSPAALVPTGEDR